MRLNFFLRPTIDYNEGVAALSLILLQALPHVLVLGAGKPPATRGFIDGLRIQLANTAVVDTTADDVEGPQKIDAALARGEAAGAVLTVWVEEGVSEFVMYAALREGEHARVEIVRMPARGGADVQRAMALKLAAVLEAALTKPPPPPAIVAPPPPPPPPPPRETPSVLLEAGAFGAAEGDGNAGAQGALSVAAGATLRRSAWAGEAYVRARFASALDVAGMGGHMTAREWSIAAGASLVRGERLAFGGALEAGVRLVDATGTASDGRMGSVDRAVPTLVPMLEGRARLTPSLSLRLAAGPEIALRHQSFVAAGAPVADLGTVRPVGELCLVISLR